MKSTTSKLAVAGSMILLAARLAQAHPGHAGHGGFSGGFAHPLSGIDHMLAMVAVGLLATQIGGRALWALPATFLTLMISGGLLNLAGISVPLVEQGIMASVLALGLLIAFAAKMPLIAPLSLVALFALFHGYAHVAEMSAGTTPAGYAIGFITATALLHVVGITLGLAARQTHSNRLVRLAGATIAACGVLMFVGLI